MQTNLTYQVARSLCYKTDQTRPSLEHLQYRPDHGDLVATNGTALIKYKVKVDAGDKPVLINPKTFKTKISDPKKQYMVQETQCSEQYPDITCVEQNYSDAEVFEVGINLDLLKKLCNAAPKDINGGKKIKLRIPKDGMSMKAIEYSQIGNDNKVDYSGLIMPCRLEVAEKGSRDV